MRRALPFHVLIVLLLATFPVAADTGSVTKVLPHFLDLEGRSALSPSLYDRDAYQAQLRQHPEQCSGMRFDILWRARSQTNKVAKLRLELRGTAKGNLPSQITLETEGRITGTSHWAKIPLAGEKYKAFGAITAWRVTLWSGDQIMIGEQKSFLW
jgi:hypothetical protein